jgi:hypothetical protein
VAYQAGAVSPSRRAIGDGTPQAMPNGCASAAPVETGAAADNKNRRGNAPGGVVKVAAAMMVIPSTDIVVRPGRGVPRLFDPAASRGEAGASLKGLPLDVKLLPKFWLTLPG